MERIGRVFFVTCLLVVLTNFGALALTTYASEGMEFDIRATDLPSLTVLLKQYAKANSLTFEDVGPGFPLQGDKPVFWVNLVQGDFIDVTATNLDEKDQVQLLFYSKSNDPHSGMNADLLISEVRKKWPHIHPLKVHP